MTTTKARRVSLSSGPGGMPAMLTEPAPPNAEGPPEVVDTTTACHPPPRPQGPAPRPARRQPVRRRPRRVDHERRAPVDRARSGPLPGLALLGRQLVHAHLRRVPAARRAPGRHPRSPPHLRVGPHPLRDRLVRRRVRPVRDDAHRRPRRAGPRRRPALPRRAVDPHLDVPRGRRAQPRPGRLGRRRRRRRRGRRPARRHPHGVPQLALGPLRQRADRGRRDHPRAAPGAREPRRARAQRLRRGGRVHRHRRPGRPDLRPRRRQQRRLGLGADDRAARARGRPAPELRGDRVADGRAAGPVRRLPVADAHRAPTRPACSSAPRCSRCSSSSRCTCSRCSAGTR